MDIYDKTQDGFRKYAPECESEKHFKLTMALTGLLLVLLLGLLIVSLLDWRFFVQRAGICILFCIGAVYSVFYFFFSASQKRILSACKMQHDYQFCMYKRSNPLTASSLLVKMAAIEIAEDNLTQAASALNLVQENRLKAKETKRYRLILEALDNETARLSFRRTFFKETSRKEKLFAALQVASIIIFLISLLYLIILFSLYAK